ncbi:MAG: hypothetical protein ABJL57_11620 [Hyphomonas sp.]|jgi:hypothetical protein|uniref:hypothetical protein n=1 Tax=Hyphomonas sp. TaxID=87 RepID=UPI0032649A54
MTLQLIAQTCLRAPHAILACALERDVFEASRGLAEGELIRYCTPVQMKKPRHPKKDMEFHGRKPLSMATDPASLTWIPRAGLRGLKQLPVRFG